MTKPETPSIPSDRPIKRATAPKASTGKSAPKATITVHPEGLGWVVRLGREFLRDAQGVIQTYATAGEAKREVLTWRPIAPSIAARQRGSRRVKRREEL